MLLGIITHPDNKQAAIGSNVTLTCTSSISTSDVIITWSHNDTIIWHQQPVNSDTSGTSRLTISNVRYRDSGSYRCTCIVWKTPSLSVTSNSATITVHGKLNNTGSYVLITLYSSQTSN